MTTRRSKIRSFRMSTISPLFAHVYGLCWAAFVCAAVSLIPGSTLAQDSSQPQISPVSANVVAEPDLRYTDAGVVRVVDSPPPQTSGGPGGGPRRRKPGYLFFWAPPVAVVDLATDMEIAKQSFSIGMPVYRDEEDMLILRTSLRNVHYMTDAILPDTGREFPEELWNVEFGANYFRKFDNGWNSGLMMTLGSASDKPFDSARELRVTAIGFLSVPAENERDDWQFSFMYSPFSDFTYPVPGVAYGWRPSDDFHMNIGLPFSLMWRPAEDLVFNVSYVPLFNVNALLTYTLTEDVYLYGGYVTVRDSYLLTNREDREDQFLSSEQQVLGGINWALWRHAALDLSSGFTFARYFGEGGTQRSDLHDIIDLDPGAFIQAQLVILF